jgi:hypothetical protein
MPLSREAQQVSNDISEAGEVFRERKINGALDPVALTIEIARLIGEERRGRVSTAGSVPLDRVGSTRLKTGTDPVSVARNHPRVPFAPTAEPSGEVSPKRSHKKKDVKIPVAPKSEPKARKRPSRRH